jgi:hypothetical protein
MHLEYKTGAFLRKIYYRRRYLVSDFPQEMSRCFNSKYRLIGIFCGCPFWIEFVDRKNYNAKYIHCSCAAHNYT